MLNTITKPRRETLDFWHMINGYSVGVENKKNKTQKYI